MKPATVAGVLPCKGEALTVFSLRGSLLAVKRPARKNETEYVECGWQGGRFRPQGGRLDFRGAGRENRDSSRERLMENECSRFRT